MSGISNLSNLGNVSFKARLADRERLIGTWIKTPSSIVVEVLADTPLDLLVLDAEHAPFGRMELDACVFACRALAKPCIVRVPTSQPHDLLQALDLGCTGLLVPHVRSGVEAAAIVRASHYGPGGRGYAGSSRAANYGTKSIADRPREQTALARQPPATGGRGDTRCTARRERFPEHGGGWENHPTAQSRVRLQSHIEGSHHLRNPAPRPVFAHRAQSSLRHAGAVRLPRPDDAHR